MMTDFLAFAKGTAADSSRTNITICRYKSASGRCHINFEIVPFGKNFHTQKIRPFAAGIKVKWPLGGICHGVPGHEKTFKYVSLILCGDADPIVVDEPLNSVSSLFDLYFYLAFIGGVFNGIPYEPINHFL